MIDQSDINNLNDSISTKTRDLTDILTKSKITIGTTFGLPTLLSDFWEKLSVSTSFEKTEYVDSQIKGKGESRPLNQNQFKIPLTSRGDGIKSKYIPPLLEWLNQKNKDRIYIWGIDEPENSLEFGLAEELAALYFSDYSKDVQCFLTSHSLAFINPPKNTNSPPTIFRCLKNDFDCTEVLAMNTLLEQSDKFDLFEEIGILEVQEELIEKFREYKRQLEASASQLDDLNTQIANLGGHFKCIVLSEDSDLTNLKLLLAASGFRMQETDVKTYEGCSNLVSAKLLNAFLGERFPKLTLIVHIDRDYNTDEEIAAIQNKFAKQNINLFVTKGTDIESHFLIAEHINFCHPDLSVIDAQKIIEESLDAHKTEAIDSLRNKNFGEKHASKSSHADDFIKSLPEKEPFKYVKGKSAYKTAKQLIKQRTKKKVNAKLNQNSNYLKDSDLMGFSKKIWVKRAG